MPEGRGNEPKKMMAPITESRSLSFGFEAKKTFSVNSIRHPPCYVPDKCGFSLVETVKTRKWRWSTGN